MSSLDLLDTQEQAGGLFGAQYVPKDAWDILSEGVPSLALPTSLGYIWDNTAISQRNSEVEKRTGKSIDDLTGMKEGVYRGSDATKARYEKLDSLIQDGRKRQDPLWSDIRTTKEVQDEVSQLGKEQEARFASSINQANSTSAKVVGIGSSALSSIITDPINLATLPLGASASMGVIRAIGMEALINAGIEVAEIPLYKAWADRVGREYGVKEAALDVATAGVGAGAITGILRGVGALGRKALGVSMEKFDKLASSKNIASDVKDNLKYQSRVKHIDENLPWDEKELKARESIAENRAALNETKQAFYDGRNPKYSETVTRLSKAIEKPKSVTPSFVKKPQDIIEFITRQGGINSKDKNIGDVKITDLKTMNKGYAGILIKKDGKNLDDLREAAELEGFLPPESTVADFLRAIDETARGNFVFSSRDAGEVARYKSEIAANPASEIMDNETQQVFNILNSKGVRGVSVSDMGKIAEKHLRSKDPDETLEDAVVDFLERQGMKEFDGIIEKEPKIIPDKINKPTIEKSSQEEDIIEKNISDSTSEEFKYDEKNLFRLSEDELERELKISRLSDNEKLVKALGEEKAKLFEKLDREQNSMNPVVADRASAEMDELTNTFTPEQDRLVFGIGETGATAEDFKDLLEAHKRSNFNETDSNADIAGTTGNAMIGKDPIKVMDVLNNGGTIANQAAFIRITKGVGELRARGVSPQEIPTLIVKSMYEQGRGKASDIAELIGNFVSEVEKVSQAKKSAKQSSLVAIENRQKFTEEKASIVQKTAENSNTTLGKPSVKAPEEMSKVLDELVEPEVLAGLEARFAQMVKESPDEIVLNDRGEEVRLSEIMDEFTDLEEEVKAVKTCGVVL